MTWLKIDDGMVEHAKCVGLSSDAWTLWLHGLCYCSRNLTDGHIPRAMLARLSALRAPKKAAVELVTAGLWHETGPGWEIHDYLAYQRSADQVNQEREAANERKRAGRVAAAERKRASRQRQDTGGTSPAGHTDVTPMSQSCHTDVAHPVTLQESESESESELKTKPHRLSEERAWGDPSATDEDSGDPLDELVPGLHQPVGQP